MKSIIQTDTDKCFICGKAYGSEWHHVFGGNPNRRFSEEDGLKIRVCRSCHAEIHEGPNTEALQRALHKLGQEKYEAQIGTHEEFVKRYGRNWL